MVSGMKFSISVPDELWESARSVVAGDSPSAVVQEALRRLTSEHAGGPSYAETPAMDEELAASLATTRQRLLEEARELYQSGYRSGVELAGRLSWGELSWIVGQGVLEASKSVSQTAYDIHMGGKLPPSACPMIEPKLLGEYTGSHADFTGTVNWTPGRVAIEGMDRALRDVWEHVRTPDGAPTQRTQQ